MGNEKFALVRAPSQPPRRSCTQCSRKTLLGKIMKTPVWFAAFTLLLATRSVALTPVSEAWSGFWKGGTYSVFVDSPKHLAAVPWDPESADVPFRVADAVKAARASLKKMVGESHVHFDCDEVRLRDVGGTRKWVYIVQFTSDHPSHTTKVEEGVALAVLSFIIYLDGFVQSPEKTKNA